MRATLIASMCALAAASCGTTGFDVNRARIAYMEQRTELLRQYNACLARAAQEPSTSCREYRTAIEVLEDQPR